MFQVATGHVPDAPNPKYVLNMKCDNSWGSEGPQAPWGIAGAPQREAAQSAPIAGDFPLTQSPGNDGNSGFFPGWVELLLSF